MPEVKITIAGRGFDVSCQPGDEAFLQQAALILDRYASATKDQLGRMPEQKMLLMAGLMLADRTAALEAQVKTLEADLSQAQQRVQQSDLRIEAALANPTEIEIPVTMLPEGLNISMGILAAQAEALADRLEDVAADELA